MQSDSVKANLSSKTYLEDMIYLYGNRHANAEKHHVSAAPSLDLRFENKQQEQIKYDT